MPEACMCDLFLQINLNLTIYSEGKLRRNTGNNLGCG